MANAIFIVGYYRSGTSALSGALQRLGVKFYNEADPNEHNPLGFYEIPELIQLDVELFTRLGVDWMDVRGLAAGWHERADMAGFAARLEEGMRRRFTAEFPLWGLKHPHLCRTLPLYERVARQAGHTPHVVHIFRDPWTAAASQQTKNGLSRAHALLLWLSYVTDAERQARHLSRVWLTYHDLLAAPARELKRIEEGLGLGLLAGGPKMLREAAGFFTRQLDRSVKLAADDLAAPLQELVVTAWEGVQARQAAPAFWDDIAARTRALTGFLSEIGASRARALPAFGGSYGTGAVPVAPVSLRPAEREDTGAKRRLAMLREAAGALPGVAVFVVAPAGRAAGLNVTLESLRAQWQAPERIAVIAADDVRLEGVEILPCGAAPEAATRALCAALNDAAPAYDYVAVLNAGDRLSPDACLRFALAARASEVPPSMIYCDEIVPREGRAWVRYKPGWDVTRLRQAAYIGDWVWYAGAAVAGLGGFDAARAGAEEYDLQLRIAESKAPVKRLPEALFTRAAQSRRDDIPPALFCQRALEALGAHMRREKLPGVVQNRQFPGLFHVIREVEDPGTTAILLCEGAEIADLDRCLTALLTVDALSGPVILAGAALTPGAARYLTAVAAQTAALEGKILAVPPALGLTPGDALALALARVETELVVVLDARAQAMTPDWQAGLRARLADLTVALVGARTLVKLPGGSQATVQGPLVEGADARLGAGHLADDPGPGGWLIVDQEASAVAPPGMLARTATLRSFAPGGLAGDALWQALGRRVREAGSRIVWTPDVSFLAPAACVETASAAALDAVDAYHHPALSLHGDLLAPEQRLGLVPEAPEDGGRVLLSGAAGDGAAVLNTLRALRAEGSVAANWAPEPLMAAELVRCGPARWVRVNPAEPAPLGAPAYDAVFTRAPADETAVRGARGLYATSPVLVKRVRKLLPPGRVVNLWRPALTPALWAAQPVAALNTKPRILWIDEGIEPDWLAALINATSALAAWIVVTAPGARYGGEVARLEPPADEAGWAQALSGMAPHVMIRPVGTDAQAAADCYPALLAMAAGCAALVDARLDMPPGLPVTRLPNQLAAWQAALDHAVEDLTGTLKRGAAARAAALALTTAGVPGWARVEAARLPVAAE